MKRTIIRASAAAVAAIMFFGVMGMLSSCQTVGTTYYISSSKGDDTNGGTSQSSPWKSFENLKAMTLTEGDRVLLARGDEWNERLTVRGEGTEEHPITVGAYGKGEKPMIRLNGERDDICLVVTDLSAVGERLCRIAWITVEDIAVSRANVGIYVRGVVHGDCEGVVIRNIEAYDIYCDSQLNRMGHGCTLEQFVEMKSEPQGDLPYINNALQTVATGGGAGEFMYSIAILVMNKQNSGFTGVEVYNNVMYNCITGVEIYRADKVAVHDNIVTGSYAGVFRLSLVNGAEIFNNRILGGSEKYTFFGGTCGGYAAICTDINVFNNEFAYEYNMGENDGTGFDYEAYCKNATLTDNVFHHNDAGGVLVMANENTQHENVLLDGNLFYGDIVNPKNYGYCYEILFINKGKDNITFRNMYLYTRERANNMKTYYYGCAGVSGYGGTIIEPNNVTETLNKYRSRFSFNKDGNAEGFSAHTGTLTVAGGKAVLKAEGKTGAAWLSLPQNGFCCNNLVLNVENDVAGSVYLQYTAGGKTVTSESVKISGAGQYTVALADSIINGTVKDLMIVWKPSAQNGELAIDSAAFTPDIGVTAVKSGDNEFTLTFTGKCFPVIALEPSASDIRIEGYSVKSVSRIGYNRLAVTTDGAAGNASKLKVTVNGGLFIQYFADLINGLDVGRTAADDATLLGCEPQNYGVLNGSLTLISK